MSRPPDELAPGSFAEYPATVEIAEKPTQMKTVTEIVDQLHPDRRAA
jgi:hypothetical protein